MKKGIFCEETLIHSENGAYGNDCQSITLEWIKTAKHGVNIIYMKPKTLRIF